MAAVNANIPTEMAMKLLKEWNARGYGLDVVMYKKYNGSTYVDPHEEDKVEFKDLPNRFPSVLSRDFRREQGQYEDFDNLFAMYLLYNLARYSVRVNDETKVLEIEKSKKPMAYPEAAELATQSAKSDSEGFLRRLPFLRTGTEIGDPAEQVPRRPAQAPVLDMVIAAIPDPARVRATAKALSGGGLWIGIEAFFAVTPRQIAILQHHLPRSLPRGLSGENRF
jgi:hypothetical protein